MPSHKRIVASSETDITLVPTFRNRRMNLPFLCNGVIQVVVTGTLARRQGCSQQCHGGTISRSLAGTALQSSPRCRATSLHSTLCGVRHPRDQQLLPLCDDCQRRASAGGTKPIWVSWHLAKRAGAGQGCLVELRSQFGRLPAGRACFRAGQMREQR